MRVSVIIPCHNAEPYLAQTIGSVLEQSRPPDEIIVVDDGSTDGSRAIAASFGDRVRVVQERNGNAPATRNRGAALATGDALMFLDADDVLGPTALEALVEELERQGGGIAACPWYRLELTDGVWVRRPPSCAPRRPGQDALDAWLRGWYHPPCSVLWARAAYERTGGWDPRARVNNDGDLMMQALARGVPLHLTSDGAAFYRRLPEGAVSLSGTRFTEVGLRARIGVIERVAGELESCGRLGPYRAALDEAFGHLTGDCSNSYADLAAECVRLRRRYGDPTWARAAQGFLRRARARLRRLRQAVSPRSEAHPEAHPEAPLEVIRFGLDTAEHEAAER